MKEKIERERKKKSLLQQIQNEISRIKGNNEEAEDDVIDDETPAWLKLVISNQNKDLMKGRKREPSPKPKIEICSSETGLTDNEAFETPGWIKIFQERSEKLNKAKKELNIEKAEEPISPVEESGESLESMMTEEPKSPRVLLNIDYDTAISQNEAIVQKSVKDLREKLQNKDHCSTKEKEEKVIKRETKIIDRVRKVKSMLLEGESKKDKTPKEDAKIAKGKAKKIKHLFETNESATERQQEEKPRKPKRKKVRQIKTVIMSQQNWS